MKKKFILIFIVQSFILSLLIGCTPTSSNQLSSYDSTIPNRSDVINVKDYGAIGDGKHDDTEAIQKAFKIAEEEGFSRKVLNEEQLGYYFGGMRKVYFPFGQYKISSTLKLGFYVNIEGDDAILVPSKSFENSSDFAFDFLGWQCHIDGMQFVNFNNALNIDNNNINTGKVVIRNCNFLKNKVAIQLNAKSSLTVINENRFVANDKVLVALWGDKVVFSQNWIQIGVLTGIHDAQIINHNSILHFNENLLVPKQPQSDIIEPAWINNYNSVIAQGVRQGGEKGAMTLVNNFAKARTSTPVFPNCVIVKDSECYGNYGSTKTYREPTVVRLIEVPNQIVIENVRGMINGALMDYSQYLKSSRKQPEVMDPDFHEVRIDGVISPWVTRKENYGIPEELNKLRKQKWQ